MDENEELKKIIDAADVGGEAEAVEADELQEGEAAVSALAKRLLLELKGMQLDLEIKTLELEVAKKNAVTYQDQLRRMDMEFDNFRRRTRDDAKRQKEDGVIEAVNRLLSVYDTIKIAIDMTEDEASKSGMNMVLRQFKDGLYNLGVSEIEAEGCTFDPNYHDAILSEQGPAGTEAGTILQVLTEGFVIGGRVLRHASVKVSN